MPTHATASLNRPRPVVNVDAIATMDEYLDRSDWRVNANANQGYPLGGLILNTAGKVTANYWPRSGLRRRDRSSAPRRRSTSTTSMSTEATARAGPAPAPRGRTQWGAGEGRIESASPPSAALGQIVNFLGTMQNDWAGAQAFSSSDTYLRAIRPHRPLTYDEVYQGLQEMVFSLNVSPGGAQDPVHQPHFRLDPARRPRRAGAPIGGEECEFTYGSSRQRWTSSTAPSWK